MLAAYIVLSGHMTTDSATITYYLRPQLNVEIEKQLNKTTETVASESWVYKMDDIHLVILDTSNGTAFSEPEAGKWSRAKQINHLSIDSRLFGIVQVTFRLLAQSFCEKRGTELTAKILLQYDASEGRARWTPAQCINTLWAFARR